MRFSISKKKHNKKGEKIRDCSEGILCPIRNTDDIVVVIYENLFHLFMHSQLCL